MWVKFGAFSYRRILELILQKKQKLLVTSSLICSNELNKRQINKRIKIITHQQQSNTDAYTPRICLMKREINEALIHVIIISWMLCYVK